MTKTLKVSEDTYWRLKAAAVEKRVPMAALVESLVEELGSAVPVKNPAQGWRQPADATSPVARPRPKAQKVGPAVTKPDLQAKVNAAVGDSEQARVERMKAALAAMPVKAPIDPKDVRAGKTATGAAHADDDDVAF